MFRLVENPTKIIPNEIQGGTLDDFFWVDNDNLLVAEFQSKGATIVYGITYQQS